MDELLALDSADEVREWVAGRDADEVRPALLAEFGALREYRNATEWNRVVRVCEALALVGWGDEDPVEASAERWMNGLWYTGFRRPDFSHAYGGERGWVTRQGMQVLDGDNPTTDGTVEDLASQRIYLPKNPIRITRGGNVQSEALPFADEAERLRTMLNQRLARDYGPGFDYVGIMLSFSIPDAGKNLASEYFHDAADVIERPDVRSFVRERLEAKRISTRQGQTIFTVWRHYTSAEGRADLASQCDGLASDLRQIVDIAEKKLRRKAPDYRFDLLQQDLGDALSLWHETRDTVAAPA